MLSLILVVPMLMTIYWLLYEAVGEVCDDDDGWNEVCHTPPFLGLGTFGHSVASDNMILAVRTSSSVSVGEKLRPVVAAPFPFWVAVVLRVAVSPWARFLLAVCVCVFCYIFINRRLYN